MTLKGMKTFEFIDYCAFGTVLIVSAGIGVVMSFRGNKTPEDFLFGNRSFKPIPVAMSLLTSVFSSIALLGYSGEVYAYGLQISLMVVGITLALVFCNFVTLPVLFPLQLTSIYEYILLRFKSKPLLILVLFASFVTGILHSGLCLYAPTLALASVTPLSITTNIYLLGAICTLYSTIGGIKAVIWTDVFQLSVVVIGLILIVTFGCYNIGGITKVWEIAIEGGRSEIFNMNLGIYERRTFFNVILYGFFYFVAIHGTAQIGFQRMNCVQTIQEARFVLLSNIVGYPVVYFIMFTCGIVCYATYVGCDPLALGKITTRDQILAFFVVDKLSNIIGLPGIFVATLIGGSLSSLSSMISAIVSTIWNDCLSPYKVFSKASPYVATLINKILSMCIGLAMIGIAFLASRTESLLYLNFVISGGSYGPVMGLFMLGLLFPKCSTKGAWCGLIFSWTFMCWIIVGGLMYKHKSVPLPVSIDNCTEFTNSSLSDYDHLNETFYSKETSSFNEEVKQDEYVTPLMWFYGISSTLYPAIGSLICIAVGLIASTVTGLQSVNEVSPLLVAPCVRRFYWSKEDLFQAEKIFINN